MICGPRFHAIDELRQIRERLTAIESDRNLREERQLHIRAGQIVADEVLAALKLAVEKAEMVFGFALDARQQAGRANRCPRSG